MTHDTTDEDQSSKDKPFIVEAYYEAAQQLTWPVVTLTQKDCAAKAFALHTLVREYLEAQGKHYLMPKTLKYFEDLCAGRTGLLLGVEDPKNTGELLGIAAVIGEINFEQALVNGSLTYPDHDKTVTELFEDEPIAVIQSALVAPHFGRRGVCQSLLTTAKDIATLKMYKHVFAQVAKRNNKGIAAFNNAGLGCLAGWVCKDHDRILVHADLCPKEVEKKGTGIALPHYLSLGYR